MARFSAQQVYGLISKHSLTDEQAAAIEVAPLDAPSLVIAGAGSGKTELMMVRVLYLVANGFARPEQILGLTFTRKAASELAARIQQGLIRLRESPLWPTDLEQDFLPAKIATYNSFGNEIFRSMALSLGYETDAQLISDATALDLAREVVEQDDEIDAELDLQLETLAERIVSLSSEMTDNLVSQQQLVEYYRDLADRLTSAPKTDAGEAGRFSYTEKHLASLGAASEIARLTGKYREQKFLRNYLDFADQVALSLEVADSAKAEDFRFVLLDEYQDTSPIQSRLLAKLFRGKPVMAVGDPNQSIYGWRGASSANLADFFVDFGSGSTFTLSASWRSGAKILDAANLIADSIPNTKVEAVKLRAGLERSGSVVGAIYSDQETEARAVANWIASKMSANTTGAILFRTKEAMRLYAQELTSLGVTHEITGLSALLEQPEVVDLISILRVLVDPEATVELMRLITGARYQLPAEAVVKLHQLAQQASRRRAEVERDKPLTLVEILDELANPKFAAQLDLPAEEISRLKALGSALSNLRTQLALSVAEVAWLAIREFELDIELFAHSDAENPLANLQAFIGRISDYEMASDRPTVSGFVAWLDQAKRRENFELPKSGAKKGVVQLMSIHSAKGLEWDLVAVPNLNKGSFPTAPKDSLAWLSGGKLPPSLRLDAAELPKFSGQFSSQRDFNEQIEAYKAAVAQAQLIEERRLAYVAITRAASELMLSASYFKRSAKGARETSLFLTELIDSDLIQIATSQLQAERPEFSSQIASWPLDPLPSRQKWRRAAEAVEQAGAGSLGSTAELALLLAERERPGFEALPQLPYRLSASAIVSLLQDPEEFSARLLRPLPSLFSEAAEAGTVFHASLEQAFLAGSELEISSWSEPQQKLGVNFLNSRFADLKPAMVEQYIEFSLGGSVVVCKLDAVFEISGGYQIVDWKSGKRPTDEAEISARAFQLALYRIGLCRLLKLNPEQVQASFFFAEDGSELAPDLLGEKELEKMLRALRTARPNPLH